MLEAYVGNYSSFEKQRAERLMLLEKNNIKIMKKREHLQKFVDRFRAKASKAKQAQSRLKALDKLETAQIVKEENAITFHFFEPKKTGYPTISLRGNLGYDSKIILNQVSLNIGEGDRIGVIGLNGAGKSTLLKSIAKQIPVVSGELNFHPQTKIGYFSQYQLDLLHPDDTPLNHFQQQDPSISENTARGFLGQFGFSNDRVFEKVGVFSGGEKARLALALLIWTKPNVLVLDEPTNHLDMSIRESLLFAMENFPGALLLVSHDRYFIECSVDQLWLVNDGRVSPFEGTLQDYENQQLLYQSDTLRTSAFETTQEKKPKPNQKLLQQLEKQMSQLEKQLKTIESALADPALYESSAKTQLIDLQKKQKQLGEQLKKKEEEWLKHSLG
jgi:ATP-binding cassette subfamily F protein 3